MSPAPVQVVPAATEPMKVYVPHGLVLGLGHEALGTQREKVLGVLQRKVPGRQGRDEGGVWELEVVNVVGVVNVEVRKVDGGMVVGVVVVVGDVDWMGVVYVGGGDDDDALDVSLLVVVVVVVVVVVRDDGVDDGIGIIGTDVIVEVDVEVEIVSREVEGANVVEVVAFVRMEIVAELLLLLLLITTELVVVDKGVSAGE